MVVDHDLKDADAQDQITYIRKVLGIVSVQFTLTLIFCAMSQMSKTAGNIFKNPLTHIVALTFLIVCCLVIIFDKERRRRAPENYFWLAVMTFGQACFFAAICADLKLFGFLVAIMAVCSAMVGLFGAALFSSATNDRSRLIGNMVAGLLVAAIMQFIVLIVISKIFPFKYQDETFSISLIFIASAGAWLIFSLFFVILPSLEDKDDYILGAMRLYLEIVIVIMLLIAVLGGDKKKRRG